MAVVAAGELHDPVPAGGAAGRAHGRHGGLGPRGDETDLVATGHGSQMTSARRTSPSVGAP